MKKIVLGVVLICGLIGIIFATNLNIVVNSDEKIVEELNESITKDEEIIFDFNAELNQLIEKYQSDVGVFSFYYYSPNSSSVFFYNEEESYLAASTVKMVVAMVYYDKIDAGKLNFDSELLFCDTCYEYGGSIGEMYAYGDTIKLDTLLHTLIVESDNSAMQILINDMGGLVGYRDAIFQYSDKEYEESFVYSNLTNTNFSMDILKHLYENCENYNRLIDDLKLANKDEYLAQSSKYPVAHKYGALNMLRHYMGIIYTPEPFLIVVLSDNMVEGEQFIGELNELFIQYHSSKDGK